MTRHPTYAGGTICGCTWGWWREAECVCNLAPGHDADHHCGCGEEWEDVA